MNYNLKIPLNIIKNYGLSPITTLVYGEIFSICSKKGFCFFSDRTLSNRLGTNKSAVQRSIHELKKIGLIKRLKTSSRKSRKLSIQNLNNVKQFILIPNFVLDVQDITPREKILYGYLLSERMKREKIDRDKHQLSTFTPLINITKTKIANDLHVTPSTILRNLKHLEFQRYLIYSSFNGKYVEVKVFNYFEYLNLLQKWALYPLLIKVPDSNLLQKWVSTYCKIDYQPISKQTIDLLQKWRTNRILNRLNNRYINKDHPRSNPPVSENDFASEPIYYDALPDLEDMPPSKDQESESDITLLNKIDRQETSPQRANTHSSAKSGSKRQVKTPSQQSKPSMEQTYHTYNGYNLDYQCKALQSMLRSITGKHYVLTKQNYPLLEQRLKDGYTLEDFEFAITSLHNKHEDISINNLITHISNYVSKTNSN